MTCNCCQGACCQGSGGSCSITDPQSCAQAGGVYQGQGTTCAQNLCNKPACCVRQGPVGPDGPCSRSTTTSCPTGQRFAGTPVPCTTSLCIGQCCYVSNGTLTCADIYEYQCRELNGVFPVSYTHLTLPTTSRV